MALLDRGKDQNQRGKATLRRSLCHLCARTRFPVDFTILGQEFRRNGVGSREIEMAPVVLITIGTDSSGDKADDSGQSQVVEPILGRGGLGHKQNEVVGCTSRRVGDANGSSLYM